MCINLQNIVMLNKHVVHHDGDEHICRGGSRMSPPMGSLISLY